MLQEAAYREKLVAFIPESALEMEKLYLLFAFLQSKSFAQKRLPLSPFIIVNCKHT